MKNFTPFNPGDPISAAKLNDLAEYAGVAQSSLPTTPGTFFNSQRTNTETGTERPSVVLVFATEDFAVQQTDHASVDDCPSGLCNFVDLIRSTNIYTPQATGRDFYVHDPIAGATDATSKVLDDVFHAVWNKNSKRWEVLAGGGSLRLIPAKVLSCLGEGWHEVELTDWDETYGGATGSSSASSSASASASVSDDPCDVCSLVDTDIGAVVPAGCESLESLSVTRSTGTPTGEVVYAHTTRLMPMKVGGLIKMLKRTVTSTGSSTSGSVSVSDEMFEDRTYDVVDGVWPLISLPFPKFECCTDPVTGVETVEMVQCNKAVVEGYICVGPDIGCPAASGSVP